MMKLNPTLPPAEAGVAPNMPKTPAQPAAPAPDDTFALTLTTDGPAPAALPVLVQPSKSRAIVPQAALEAARQGLPGTALEGADPAAFRALATEARAMVGASRQPHTPLDLRDMRPRGFIMVPETHILAASWRVGEQKETWACGLNSGARFAMMLNQPINNYQHFLDHAPYNFDFLGIPKVGPDPTHLRNYLEGAGELQGTGVQKHAHDSWWHVWPRVLEGLQMGRPSIVLLCWQDTLMHYVNVVGYKPGEDRIALLDVNGAIYEISLHELKHEMNGSQTWLRRLNGISDYNAISANGAIQRKADVVDEPFYRAVHDDLQNENLMAHMDAHGLRERRVTAPWFDMAYYRTQIGAAHMSDAQVAAYYMTTGIDRGDRASLVFDPKHYLRANGDLGAAFGLTNYRAALSHYMEHGQFEHRDLSAEFKPQRYLNIHGDVRAALGGSDLTAIQHYYKHGRGEGRRLA